MSFETNVFINCPFDKDYKPILKSIIFCLIYLDHTPLLSETINSAESRISNIQDLIERAKYSIHDISRMKSSRKNELARFNMPFELGMDIGCKRYGNNPHQSKCLLILEEEKYRYQKSISDIAGNDIAIHNNEPEKAIRQVRNWILKIRGSKIDSANIIWTFHNEFLADFHQIANENNLNDADIEEMPWDEYFDYIRQWIEQKRSI